MTRRRWVRGATAWQLSDGFQMTFFSRAKPSRPQLSPDRFDRAKGVVGTRQADTTVLLDVNNGMYYTLNEVGGRIWDLLGDGTAVSLIVERLQEEYDVPPGQLDADVRALVDRLQATRLIVPARR